MAFHPQVSTLALLYSAPLDPLTPLYVLLSSSPTSGSASTSVSVSTSASGSEYVARASAARSFSVSRFIPSWSHYLWDTLDPSLCLSRSQRSIIGRIAMYCATIFYLLVTDFLIPSNPESCMASFRGG